MKVLHPDWHTAGKEKDVGPGLSIWDFKAHLQLHTCSNKATLPSCAPVTGNHAFKSMSLWWPFLFSHHRHIGWHGRTLSPPQDRKVSHLHPHLEGWVVSSVYLVGFLRKALKQRMPRTDCQVWGSGSEVEHSPSMHEPISSISSTVEMNKRQRQRFSRLGRRNKRQQVVYKEPWRLLGFFLWQCLQVLDFW